MHFICVPTFVISSFLQFCTFIDALNRMLINAWGLGAPGEKVVEPSPSNFHDEGLPAKVVNRVPRVG